MMTDVPNSGLTIVYLSGPNGFGTVSVVDVYDDHRVCIPPQDGAIQYWEEYIRQADDSAFHHLHNQCHEK